MKKPDIKLFVGIFVLLGIASLTHLSIRIARVDILGGEGITVFAEFENSGGVKAGSLVEIAGVEVGKVKRVTLSDDYMARVEMVIKKSVELTEDAIASIRTKGLVGEKYVQISPGGSDNIIQEGGIITDTESAVDFEKLISKYVFGTVE